MMETNDERWGIVYCPKRGFRGRRDWARIQDALQENKVKYDFVQSESHKSVGRLVSMLIRNGYKTIVIVGGDSALNDAVNCLMDQEQSSRDKISLGVIPNGVMNDFAHYWNLAEYDIENTVAQLVNHRIRRVDIGLLTYTDKDGDKRYRYFLNCVNVGLIAAMMTLRQQTRHIFGIRGLAFISSFIWMIFQRKEYKITLKINSETYSRKMMSVCIGNGPGYGQTPRAVPYNGMLDVSLVYQPEVLQLFEGLWLLVSGRFINHKSVHPFRTHRVEVIKTRHAPVGIDGHAMDAAPTSFSIDVMQEVINFIIPK